MTRRARASTQFERRLAAITLLALAGRIAYTLAARHDTPAWGDSFSYHYGANLLADGRGFIDPLRYDFFRITTPSAYHPPLYTLYLAVWSTVGVRSILGHRLVSCLLGAAVVAVVGLAGRAYGRDEAEGARIGLVAAILAALSPALWVNDAALLSEPVAELAVAAALLALLRYRERPTPARAAVVGLLIGAAALGRAELALLFPLLVIPMWRWAPALATPQRWRIVGALAAGGLLVIGPWVGYNLSRFEKPVYLSTGLGATLSGGACNATFFGPKTGYWDAGAGCGADQVAIKPPAGVDPSTTAGHAAIERSAQSALATEGDESVREIAARHHALDYLRAHERRLPVVVLARVGRVWGLFRPWQTATFDATIEGRGFVAARSAMIGFGLLALAGIPGLVLLWRRRLPVAMFLALGAIVTFSAALTFGVQRYRAPFDAVLPILAAVAVDAWWTRGRAQARPGTRPAVVEAR